MPIHELVATDDARVWAREFVRTVRRNEEIPTDAGTMEGWFANAMCAAHDCEARRQRACAVPELTPAQKVLQEKHGNPEVFEKAVWAAHAQCFCMTDEALTAIAKYRQEWAVAGDLPVSTEGKKA